MDSASCSAGCSRTPRFPARALELELKAANLPAGAFIFEADLAAPAAPARLVNLGWDLEELGNRYQRFVRRFEGAHAALRARSATPLSGFVLRTLLIHEYRRLHLRDPLLPQRLAARGLARLSRRAIVPGHLRSRIRGLGSAPVGGGRAPRRPLAAARALSHAPLRRHRMMLLPLLERIHDARPGTHSPERRRAPGGRS